MAPGPPRGVPTAEEWLETFGGRTFAVVGGDEPKATGWGRSGDRPSHLKLRFEIGSRAEIVVVDVHRSDSGSGFRSTQALVPVVMRNLMRRLKPRARFPLTIEIRREQVQVEVDGAARSFDLYLCDRDAVAVGTVGEILVHIEASASRLRRGLGLRTMDASALVPVVEALAADAERRRQLMRRAPE